MRHLGTVIGNPCFKYKYLNNFVDYLNNQLQVLSKIAETEIKLAYAALVDIFTNKLTYFILTLPNVSELRLPLKHGIWLKVIPVITCGKLYSDKKERFYLYQPISED